MTVTMDELPDPPMYYDRKGVPITLRQWSDMYSRDPMGRIVKRDTVGTFSVSTVWIGLDHAFTVDPHRPHIFETMIFRIGEDGNRILDELYLERYSTEEESLEGHQVAVEYAKTLV